ncbi:Pkinase-domain-containing protein [Cylindrobasidium torrendii FP15055 ss-10]|uniref:Pkinase-domain-containing protein n=1 Tax=Cylindrobasidium torrendii FP15055 ss-10 TaxID=1314674 RepID=A0A0D7B569_9AGAR|nr:Pkinase-domain-containing protein [Cylindrobasidium torrendii FP15055 ss-10]
MLQYPVLRPISPSPKVKAKDHAAYQNSSSRTGSRNDHPNPRPMTSRRALPKDVPPVPRPQYTGLPSPALLSSPFSATCSTPSPTLSASKLPRNSYLSSRQASFSKPFSQSTAPKSQSRGSSRSSMSSTLDDILYTGDCVGTGATLQGEIIRLVSFDAALDPVDSPNPDEPANEFEVVRRLGAGSYAVVYLVREVLYRPPPSEDGHIAGSFDLDGPSKGPSTVYGREYAIKCLSKADLDEEALEAQMTEVTIHQSLSPHPNIVTLHRTFETSSFLLLLLEYVPGEDLFYFLEQARDHYDSDTPSTDPSSRTPPTPSLLSNLHPAQLLSRTRLRLISSMFAQMCEAVAACHAQNVFHRDIKPENFIVTDGWYTDANGQQERKVIVKLTDFGLSTSDEESSDMDCGSAPYMSYECRNNVAPTYRPRAADVWSLGIVLINMLYHYNPWTDTQQGECSSFSLFCSSPVEFFLSRFTGMTRPIAEMLANRVFNILEDSSDDSSRISAEDFGVWIRDLPDLMANYPTPARHQRGLSISSTQGFPISTSVPPSHRPVSRSASRASSAIRTPAMATRSLSRAPSFDPAFDRTLTAADVPNHIDVVEEQEEPQEPGPEAMITSRSTSTNKRRKRGTRKGKGGIPPPTPTPDEDTLDTLATASQSLAREISKASKVSKVSERSVQPSVVSATSMKPSNASTSSSGRRAANPYEPSPMYALPTALMGKPRAPAPLISVASSRPPASPTSTSSPAQTHPTTSTTSLSVGKKPSKWRLGFGKPSAPSITTPTDPVSSTHEHSASTVSLSPSSVGSSMGMSATASNVASLIMGLDAPPALPLSSSPPEDEPWRGRRGRASPSLSPHSAGRDAIPKLSPSPHRIASSASSTASNNWRSSMSTTSSGAFSSRYSNSSASVKSMSTTATSVSNGSWRAGPKSMHSNQSSTYSQGPYQNVPKNIKIMDGVPWELDELPRGQYVDTDGDLFGTPPVRKRRTRKGKDAPLGTISERPKIDVAVAAGEVVSDDDTSPGGTPSGKAQRGQINTLAKMLSALRR